MLSKVRNIILVIFTRIMFYVLRIFWLFPIKDNQIMFSSYWNKYTCNPKYIYEKLIMQFGAELSYVWVAKKNIFIPNYSNTILVSYWSIKCMFFYLTSKLIITNTNFPPWIPFRDKQILINTWHGGGAYKKVGKIEGWETSIASRVREVLVRTDFYISSCKKFTDVMSESFSVSNDKFLSYGMPRNDLFFSYSIDINSIKNKIGIKETESIILYAPTFRGNMYHNKTCINSIGMDFNAVISAAQKRFGKTFILLYRSHYMAEDLKINIQNYSYRNVTDYPDMQELLYIADIFITDYSSSVWDYSLTFRPGFLFTPDINKYNNERGFYTPMSEWPFVYAITNEELCENILNFNEEDNKRRIKKHHSDLGNFEDGNATDKILNLIMKYVKQ